MTSHVSSVSILIRSLDRPCLDRALDSVALQDGAEIEVLVIAASGPAHRDLPERVGAHRLRVVRPERRLDRVEAANLALESAQGQLLNFLDDDDCFLPGHTRAMVEALKANPACLYAYSKSHVLDAQGRLEHVMGEPHQFVPVMQQPMFHFQTGVFARELVARGARFDPRLAMHEDIDFTVQCAQLTPLLFVDRVGAIWNAHAGGSGGGLGSNADKEKSDRAWRDLQKKWRPIQEAQVAQVIDLLAQAMECLRQSRMAQAVDLAQQACRIRPYDVHAMNMVALARMRSGDAVGARAVIDHALRLAPGFEPLLRNRRMIERETETGPL